MKNTTDKYELYTINEKIMTQYKSSEKNVYNAFLAENKSINSPEKVQSQNNYIIVNYRSLLTEPSLLKL